MVSCDDEYCKCLFFVQTPLCVKQTQKTKSELLPRRAYNLGEEVQMDRKKWKTVMRFY